MKKILTDKHK